MMQINNSKLVAAIAVMKLNPGFIRFMNAGKKKLEKLWSDGSFTYITENINKQKIKEQAQLTSVNGFKPYLELLKNNIEDIMTCDAEKLMNWKDRFDKIRLRYPNQDAIKGFYKCIEEKLNYKELRSGNNNLLFEFYALLKVKVCVYCNAQHIILLNESKIARLQADHNLPKSKYPCFSVSLANLYPTCNNCNHQKSDNELNYCLYYKNVPRKDLKFSVPEKLVANFFSTEIPEEDLAIEFDPGDSKLEEVLHISEMYENHKDYAADFLRKRKVYTESYIESLSASFQRLFGNNPDQLKRMVFGVTLNEQDINQRVFSKLLIDLQSQLDKMKTG